MYNFVYHILTVGAEATIYHLASSDIWCQRQNYVSSDISNAYHKNLSQAPKVPFDKAYCSTSMTKFYPIVTVMHPELCHQSTPNWDLSITLVWLGENIFKFNYPIIAIAGQARILVQEGNVHTEVLIL